MKISHMSYSFVVPILSVIFLVSCTHPKVPVAETKNYSSPPAQSSPADDAVATTPAAGAEVGDPSPVEAVAPLQNDKTLSENKKEGVDDEQTLLDTALELTESAQESWTDGDVDDAIASLDEAYSLILKVEGSNAKTAQQKEDLRIVISRHIMEVYASRQTVARGNSAEIPMVINSHVEREIQSFQGMERDFFVESYKRSGRYRPDIVKALKEAGIPEELSWLPLIESGFKIRALSRSRAFGLWQFIPSTGYKFGLKRNAWIDERLDPAKSTAAAIAYFKELHLMFGDWATVLAAYNCGEGAVARVIRDQKVDYLDNFWDFYERLPRETARYFPRFIAVLTIMKDPVKYGFTLDELDGPLSYETVTIERPVQLKALADKLELDMDDVRALNPELRRDATPNAVYALRVPPGKGETILACIEKMPKWSPPKVEYVMHRVRRGETLSRIAMRYRTSMQRILEANNLRSGRMLRIGQRLKIPMRNTS